VLIFIAIGKKTATARAQSARTQTHRQTDTDDMPMGDLNNNLNHHNAIG